MTTLDAKEGDRAALAEAQQGASIFDKCNAHRAELGRDWIKIHFRTSSGPQDFLDAVKVQDSGPVGGSVLPAATVEDRVKGAPSGGSDAPASTAAIEGPGVGLPPTEQTRVSTAPGASDGPALKCPNPECKNGYDGERRVGSWDWYYAETQDEQKALEAAKQAPSEFFADEHGSHIEPQDRLTIACRAYHAAMIEGMVLVSREDAE